MIKNNEKIILICGMAHSGTTILAHLLRQNKCVFNYSSGVAGWVYETEIILNKNKKTLENLLILNSDKKVLLKSPWVEFKRTKWMIENIPNAYYICCLKNFEDIKKSWQRKDSQVDQILMNESEEYLKKTYDLSLEKSNFLASNVKNFVFLYHNEIGRAHV